MSQKNVYDWEEIFKGRQKNIVAETRSGRPSIVTCVGFKEQNDQRIRDTLNLCSSLSVTYQVPHPYRITAEIVFSYYL
jgi:hypothetical protein